MLASSLFAHGNRTVTRALTGGGVYSYTLRFALQISFQLIDLHLIQTRLHGKL